MTIVVLSMDIRSLLHHPPLVRVQQDESKKQRSLLLRGQKIMRKDGIWNLASVPLAEQAMPKDDGSVRREVQASSHDRIENFQRRNLFLLLSRF